MSSMLEVQGVDVFHGDLQALWSISISVNQGEIVVLMGANGVGKTTLLRTIVGLHRPAQGSVMLDGQAIHTIPAHRIVERGIVLVPEGRRLFGSMSVLENLEVGAFTARSRREKDKTLGQVFEIFPILAERRKQIAATMSGGQQQMLAIGRALMGLPRLLLFDEPSLGLAPIIVENIFDVVRKVNQSGVTVLLVEQNVHAALELAHRAYIIEHGRVVGQGTGSELLTDENVRQAYLGYIPETTPR